MEVSIHNELLNCFVLQEERNRLLAEIENLASSDGQAHKLQDVHAQNLKSLEAQIQDLKKKQENQVQLLKQKQKSDDAAKRLQDEIHSIKAQKVYIYTHVISSLLKMHLFDSLSWIHIGSAAAQNETRSRTVSSVESL